MKSIFAAAPARSGGRQEANSRYETGIRRLAAAATICVALVSAGCGDQDSGDHAHAPGEAGHAHETEAGVTFHAKKGLLVPPATATFIGLQVADVVERKIAAALQFSGQVYRAGSEVRPASLQLDTAPTARASGNVHPEDAAGLSEGQAVTVQGAGGGGTLPGRIINVKRDLEKASGQVEVLLAIADAPQPLAAGAHVSVTAPLGGETSVVGVPRSALLRTTEGDFIYTVNGNHFVRTAVKLGLANDEFAEVTEGLYAGDQIVVQPVMTLWMAELQTLRGGKSCADGH